MSKPELSRDMKVVAKGLKGKHNTPYVVLKSADGERLEIRFKDKAQLGKYRIEMLKTVKIVPEQQKL